jgi:4a-hydroxytetrahydrobiopterin dehydratase
MRRDQCRENGAVPDVLDDAAVATALAELPGWGREGDTIVKQFQLASFPDAVAFVVRVGFLAEQANHHPDLDVRWRNVRVALTTHDAGGLTELDMALAREIEAVAGGS